MWEGNVNHQPIELEVKYDRNGLIKNITVVNIDGIKVNIEGG
jgi:hypothetical protein